MAVTVEAGSHATGSACCGNTVTITSWTPTGVCRYAVIDIHGDSGNSVSTVTRTGDTPVLVLAGDDGKGRAEMWQIVQPATGAANIVVTWAMCNCCPVIAGAINFNGVCQTTPRDAPLTSGGNCISSLSVTHTTTACCFMSDTIQVRRGCTCVVTGANQTRRTAMFAGNCVAGGSSDQDGACGGVMSWTFCLTQAQQVSINIKTSAAVAALPFPLIVNSSAMI